MNEKDISGLLKRYGQMLESGKSIYFDAEEFDELAEYYDMLDDIDTAKKIVEDGLKIHPGNQSLLIKSAKFIVYSGEYKQALEYLNRTFSEYDFDLYLLKIECLLHLDSYDEANLLTQQILDDEEMEEDIIFSELGFLYAEADYYDDAIQFFEQSLAHKPANMEVLTDLSYSYEMCNNFSKAVEITNRILDIDPYSYESWVNLGKLYSLQDEYEKAVDAFDFALTIDDSDIDVFKLKAHCLSLCGRVEEAVTVFNECIEQNPEDESVYYSLSECYFSLEQYNEMLYCLDKYEDIHGQTAEVFAKKALAYMQREEMELVHSSLDSGMSINPESEDLNIVAGEFYFRLGEFSKGEFFFLKAYDKTKNNETMLDRLSLISISNNDVSKAIEYTERLIFFNSSSMVKTRLALLYFEADDKQKFNLYLDSFDDEELRALVKLFFSEEEFDISSITRNVLINKLNEARECRQLFKNIAY